jgi:hypothetical protein
VRVAGAAGRRQGEAEEERDKERRERNEEGGTQKKMCFKKLKDLFAQTRLSTQTHTHTHAHTHTHTHTQIENLFAPHAHE